MDPIEALIVLIPEDGVMTSNIAVYEFLGYRRTGRETINGRHAVHFRKDLPRSS